MSRSTLNGADSVTVYKYNANNQVISQSDPDGNGQQSGSSPVTSYFYDRLGRQIAVRDQNGKVNAQSYDAAGNVVAEQHADGGVVRHYYNAFGEETARQDADNNLATITRDHQGRIIGTSTDLVGAYTAGANGVLNGGAQHLQNKVEYDEAGRVVAQTDGVGETTRYDVDLRGNVTVVHAPMGETDAFAFDAQGNRIAHRDANGSVETWNYDTNGQLKAHTDIGGAEYAYKYDSAGQLIEESNTRGMDIRTTYDGAGQVIQVRDVAEDKTTQYTYNLLGQHTRELTVQRGILYQDNLLGYDTNGRLARIDALADQVSVLMEYDAAGNLVHQQNTKLAHGAGTVMQQVQIDGVVQTVVHGLAATDTQVQDLWYAYDDMNRQVMIEGAANGNAADGNNLTEAQGHLVTYDKNGNRTSETYQGSQLVAEVGADGVTRYVVHQGRITMYYRYDAAGRLTETAVGAIDAQGNALNASYATVVSQNYYDADGRLQRERITSLSGVLLRETDYTGGYDAAGNVLSYTITDGSGNQSTTQISQTVSNGYQRDGAVTTKVASNGVAVSTRSSYSYDSNGNLVRTDSTSALGAVTTHEQHNDLSGHILQTKDGDMVVNRLVVGGRTYAVWQGQEVAAVAPMRARTMMRAAMMEVSTASVMDGEDFVAEVTDVYWSLLHRAPDPGGLAFWVDGMEHGLTLENLISEFMAGPEYAAVQIVYGVYGDLLYREPYGGELAGWVAAVESGTTEGQIRDFIMDTDEYRNLQNGGGGGDDGGGGVDPGPDYGYMVTQLYESLLGRDPNADDIAYWTGAMKSGMTSSQVADNIMASDEYKNRQSTTPDVANFDSSGNVVVRRNAGDTLQSLARKAYGDSSLWYLIAEANGVTFNADLSGLKTIVIPDAPVAGSAAPAGSANPFGAGVGNTAASDSASKLKDRVAQAIQNVMIGPKDPVKDTFGLTPIPSTIVQYQSGDTLDSLAEKAYGDKTYWRLISAQNNASDADLSALGSISIPDLSILQTVESRANSFAAQLQAYGMSAQSNPTIVGPARASGPSQGALDYANEMAAASVNPYAADQIRESATTEARIAAAMYLLTNPNATDAQLYVEYTRNYNWTLDSGMSDLARQAGGELAGDRMADYMAMAAGGFGSDGPDFGRADRYEQEMQAWSDAFNVKEKPTDWTAIRNQDGESGGYTPNLSLFDKAASSITIGANELGSVPIFGKDSFNDDFSWFNPSSNSDDKDEGTAGYDQIGNSSNRDVTRSGDTLEGLFIKNYGHVPTHAELVQYGNYNNLTDAHALSVNREIVSPSLDELHQTAYAGAQLQGFNAKDSQFADQRNQGTQTPASVTVPYNSLSTDEIAFLGKYLNANNNETNSSTSTSTTANLLPATGLVPFPYTEGRHPTDSGPVSAAGGFDNYGNSLNGAQFDLGKTWLADIPKVPVNLFANTVELIGNNLNLSLTLPGSMDYVSFMDPFKIPYNSGAGEVAEFGLGLVAGRYLSIPGSRTASLGAGSELDIAKQTAGATFNANFYRDADLTTGLRSAEEINAIFAKIKYDPPFTSGTYVDVSTANAGPTAHMVLIDGQVTKINAGQPAFGGFASLNDVPDGAYARGDLAITTTMKSTVDAVVDIQAKGSMVTITGKVNPQNPSSIYYGGGDQIYFDYPSGANRWDYIEQLSPTRPLPPGTPKQPASVAPGQPSTASSDPSALEGSTQSMPANSVQSVMYNPVRTYVSPAKSSEEEIANR